MGSSTPVAVGNEGTLVEFAPYCHHRMGCLCPVWAPQCLLARCPIHVKWFLRPAAPGTWATHSPQHTQIQLVVPPLLMSVPWYSQGMGFLPVVWAPKCLLARCPVHVKWFLRLAAPGTQAAHSAWAARSPRYTQSWLGGPLTLMPAVSVDIKHVLGTKFWTVTYFAWT